jgi:hypothetical protein
VPVVVFLIQAPSLLELTTITAFYLFLGFIERTEGMESILGYHWETVSAYRVRRNVLEKW